MKLKHLLIGSVIALLPALALGASPVANGTSIFPLILLNKPITNNVDGYNEMLQLLNAQVAPVAGPSPLACGATCTVPAGVTTVLLNTAAGSVATLPAATGTGTKYRFVVTTTTTSGAHKILAASSSDFINGIAYGFTGSTAKVFASAAATNHSIQMPFSGSQPSGGFIGDWFEVTDVGTNLWQVSGFYQSGTTPTTPYSSATS